MHCLAIITLRPFHAVVALQMSSPIFFGDKPSGPTFGAIEDVAPTSPPTALIFTVNEWKVHCSNVHYIGIEYKDSSYSWTVLWGWQFWNVNHSVQHTIQPRFKGYKLAT